MTGIEIFLLIIYLLLVATLGFVIIFPLLRDVCREMLASGSNADFLAFVMSLLAIGYGFFFHVLRDYMFYCSYSHLHVLVF